MSNDIQPSPLRVAVIQDGARLHYAVPLALLRAGVLHLMFSEGFLKRGAVSRLLVTLAGRFPSKQLNALLHRRADEIPPELVRTNPWLVARQRAARRKFPSDESFYQWSSQAVGDWVLRRGLNDFNALFGYIRNIDPRLCEKARSRGLLTVGDQIIAPAAIEAAEAKIQSTRWPDWQTTGPHADLQMVQEVEQATWSALDRITCASDYVRQGLIAQGIATDRISVHPYPIDATQFRPADRSRTGPLRVGFLGLVGLRKGAPYFLEVAKRLKSSNLQFVMVGPHHLPEPARKMLGESVELIGHVPRAQAADWMQKFDLFLFPSTCEGSAGAVTEAMAMGLPIITSPNSGSCVRDCTEGFIRNYDDIDAMASCVERLASDSQLRQDMGNAARARSETLTLQNYGEQLVRMMGPFIVGATERVPLATVLLVKSKLKEIGGSAPKPPPR